MSGRDVEHVACLQLDDATVFHAAAGSASNAIPAFANVDPPRMFQFQVRFIF